MTSLTTPSKPIALLALVLASSVALAQSNPNVEIDLGEAVVSAAAPRPDRTLDRQSETPALASKGGASKPPPNAKLASTREELTQAKASSGVQHVEFNRRPIPVPLQVGREGLITFPGPVVLRVPSGFDTTVSLQTIGRTVYAKALSNFETVRIVAEDLERDGRQYPIDLSARAGVVMASDEVEIHSTSSAVGEVASTSASQGGRGESSQNADMVALTRHASMTLYAPTRLIPASPVIRQVPVAQKPVPGLYRGSQIITTPIGAWRSGDLYVTAVKFVNQGQPVELDLDQLRGQWLAATAQHGRLSSKGSEADTTAVYLVCDKPFEACR